MTEQTQKREPIGIEQIYTPKVKKMYYLDFEVAQDFAKFCHYLDPPLSASQGVQEAMNHYMMVRHKDLVCTAQFTIKPIMMQEKEPDKILCGFRDCKEPSVAKGVRHGKTFELCADHLAEAQTKPEEWKVTSE